MEASRRGVAAAKPPLPLIVPMSFQPVIPGRVALQQCSPPLHRPTAVSVDPRSETINLQRTETRPYFSCLNHGVHRRLSPVPPDFPCLLLQVGSGAASWFCKPAAEEYQTHEGD